MRPRHKAAENAAPAHGVRQELGASMRPRHKAAENTRASPRAPFPCWRFNEAAA